MMNFETAAAVSVLNINDHDPHVACVIHIPAEIPYLSVLVHKAH